MKKVYILLNLFLLPLFVDLSGGLHAQCTNVTDGGTIGSSQTICGYYFSQTITNSTFPSGGTGTLEYQWQNSSNGTLWNNISGATLQNYAPGYVFTTTHYRRQARRSGCTTYDGISNTVIKTVNPVPVPNVTASGPLSFCAGGSVTLTDGFSAQLSYQWFRNYTPISGATTNSYVATVTGIYYVRETVLATGCIGNSAEFQVSDDSQLNTTITEAGFSFCASSTILLYVPTGTNYTYQWYDDANEIPNSNDYQIPVGHDGNYSCTITNSCGVFPSPPFPLTTYFDNNIPEPITISPSGSTNFCTGGSVQLIVSQSFVFPNSYQWYQGTTPIAGATNYYYDATQSGQYACLVDYWCWMSGGNEISCTNWIEVTTSPGNYPTVSITAGGPTTICQGSSVPMTATATGGSISYQWLLYSSPVSGATNATYSATTAGSYACTATNPCGSVTSNYINVNLIPTSVTITTTTGASVCSGNTVSLSSALAGNGGTYQWKLNGGALAGATQQFYTGTVQAGNYTVSITNTCGTFNSNAITFTILNNCTTGLLFDGSNDYAQIPNNAAYAFGTGTFTIEAWVNLNTFQSTWSTLYSQRSNANLYSGIWIYFYQGKLYAQYAGYGGGSWSADLRDNLCHHICVTRTAANTIKYYVDGNYMGTDANTYNSVTATSSIQLGRDTYISSSSFAGRMMEVRMWNTGRTQAEIQASMNAALTGTETGLVGYWKLDDGSGQVLNDLSSNSNDGQLGSMATPDANDPVFSATCPLTGCIQPPAVITAGGPTTFCTGGSVTFSANTGAGLTWQWLLNGTNISGATNSTYNASAAGTYSCRVSNACSYSLSNTFVVTLTTIPVVSVSPAGTTLICNGSLVTYYASYNSGYTYQWQLNGSPISGATQYYYNAGTAGTYNCVATNACGSVTSNSGIVNVNNPPTVNVSAGGPTSFCNGGSVLLTANTTGSNLSYQWKANSSPIAGATQNQYSATTAASFTCEVSNVCSTITSNATVVTLLQAPTASIAAGGPTTICSGASVTLNANSGAGFTYQWQNSGSNISGATMSYYAANGSGAYTCVITNACGNATSNIIIVNVVSPPVSTITAGGPTTYCSGGSVTLSAAPGTGYFYQWKLNSVNIAGATNSTYAAVASGSFTCVTSNSCGFVTSNTITVTVLPLPTATITAAGSTTFCTGGSVVLNANTGAGLTYQWRRNSSSISGATLSSYTATLAGSYTCQVSNTCGSNVSNPITVTVLTGSPATISSGSTVLCAGNAIQLSANTGAGLTYQWRRNGSNISGATAVSYNATQTGSYTCVVTGSCGSTTSNTITITAGPAVPGTPGPVSGMNKPCPGFTGIAYSVSNVSGATSYTWTVPATATIASGQGTTNITVNFSASYSGGTLSVAASNSCGTSSLRSKNLTIGQHCLVFRSTFEEADVLDAAIYPNPSSRYFTLRVSTPDPFGFILIVRDLLGKEVERKESALQGEIQFGESLQTGIYSAEIISGTEQKVLRIVKSQ